MESKTQMPDDSISLKELMLKLAELGTYLKSRWKTFLVVTLVGGIGGILYGALSTTLFTAKVVFVLENNKEKGSDFASIAAKIGLSMGSTSGGLFQDDENIMTLMKSRSMITQTLFTKSSRQSERSYLIDRFVEYNDLRSEWPKSYSNIAFHANPLLRTRQEDSLIGVFCKDIAENNLSISKPDKKADIIVAATVAADETFAKDFTENLLQNVTKYYTETVTKKTQTNVDILQRQVDSIRGLLNYAISGAALSSDANPNMNPAFQRLRVPSQRKMVDVEMNKAILEELVKNLELAKISLRRETPLIQAIDRPILPLEKKKPGKLKSAVLFAAVANLLSFVFLSFRFYIRRILR